ncbi:MAG: copper homeostasis protein CutC [Flavobacteriales bacterium]|nr:copper homeostasis protein CutC [Flavobacteriales bacterium]
MAVRVEICVASIEEALVAHDAGADGIEVCTWLACGGVTPSSGLVDAIRAMVPIPARVLLRPGPGGFQYTQAEQAVLLTDAEVFGAGAIGLVVGALTASGECDASVMSAVKRLAPESEITFHRAIDQAADPIRIVESCIELGIDRILTSGGATLAVDGVETIKRIIASAGEGCEVAIAGGIGPGNVVELVERTGAKEIHFAAQRAKASMQNKVAMGSTNVGVHFETVPDQAKIEGVLNALVKAGLR